ncbi:hypothetical protein MJL81_30000, partial [Salmonella enterica subsp. enterica serovar Anatum]|nr:hypothetical protein [Salmonella enterica subsp. enterica serovar Anatum]
GPVVLERIAPAIAKGLVKRKAQGVDAPLNIIACENMVRGTTQTAQDVDEVIFAWQGGEPTLMGLPFYRQAVALQQRYANGKAIV